MWLPESTTWLPSMWHPESIAPSGYESVHTPVSHLHTSLSGQRGSYDIGSGKVYDKEPYLKVHFNWTGHLFPGRLETRPWLQDGVKLNRGHRFRWRCCRFTRRRHSVYVRSSIDSINHWVGENKQRDCERKINVWYLNMAMAFHCPLGWVEG